MNHVAVGEYESIGGKEKSGTCAACLASAVPFALRKLTHLNVSHCGASRLRGSDYGVGIGIKQRPVVRDSRAGWGRGTRKC
jgi:hypothetical protein